MRLRDRFIFKDRVVLRLHDRFIFKTIRADENDFFAEFVETIRGTFRQDFKYRDFCLPEDLNELKGILSKLNLRNAGHAVRTFVDKILASEYDSIEFNINDLNIMSNLANTIAHEQRGLFTSQIEKILSRKKPSLRARRSKPYTVRLNDAGEYVVVRNRVGLRDSQLQKPRYSNAQKFFYTAHQSLSVADPDMNYMPPAFGWNKDRKATLVGFRFPPEDALPYRLLMYDSGTYGRPYDCDSKSDGYGWIKQKKEKQILHNDFDSLIQEGRKHPEDITEVMARFTVSLDGRWQKVIFSDNLHSRLLAQARAIALQRAIEQETKNKIDPFPISFYPQLTYYDDHAKQKDMGKAKREYYGLWLYLNHHQTDFREVPEKDWQQLIPVIQRLDKTSLSGLNFGKADLHGTNLSGFDLTGANLSEVNLTGVSYSKKTCFQGAMISGEQLRELMWRNDNYEMQAINKLPSFVFTSGSSFRGINFAGYDLTGIDLDNIKDLDKVSFKGVTLGRKQIEVLVKKTKDLKQVIFAKNVDLKGIDFNEVYLKNANLQNSILSLQQFVDVLQEEGIKGVNASKIDLKPPSFFSWKIFQDVNTNRIDQKNIKGAIQEIRNKIKDVEVPFRDMLFGRDLFRALVENQINLSGIKFAYATDLRGIDLSGLNLKHVSFTGTILDDEQVISVLKGGGKLANIDLRHINLNSLTVANLEKLSKQCLEVTDLKFKGAQLNADQVKMMLERGVKDFRWFDLSGLDLTDVDFRGVNLFETILSLATLDNANLSGTDLTSTRLCGASFNGTKFNGTKCSADCFKNTLVDRNSACNFDGIILDGDLERAKFKNISLRGANFCGTRISHSEFNEVDLTGATFSGQDINSLIFRNSILDLADFSQACFMGTSPFDDCSLLSINIRDATVGSSLSNSKKRYSFKENILFKQLFTRFTVSKDDMEILKRVLTKTNTIDNKTLNEFRLTPQSQENPKFLFFSNESRQREVLCKLLQDNGQQSLASKLLTDLELAIGKDHSSDFENYLSKIYKIDPVKGKSLFEISGKLILAANDEDREQARKDLLMALRKKSQYFNDGGVGIAVSFHKAWNYTTLNGNTLANRIEEHFRIDCISVPELT